MAKNKDKNKNKNKAKIDKGGVALIIILILLLILILLGGFALFVKFDIGQFGSKVMTPILEDVSVLKYILPDPIDIESNEVRYPYKNMDEAISEISKLKSENNKLKKKNDDIQDKVDKLNKELKRLSKIEKEYVGFEDQKAQYEREVVFGESALDITEYQKYYEQIDPERAEELYKQVLVQLSADEEAKKLSNTYAKMDTGSAADALEKLENSMGLVCDILLSMTEKNRAAIMNEMSPEFAAKVTKKIYDKTNK